MGYRASNGPDTYHRYLITDFNFKEANVFVAQINNLPSINHISLTDKPKNGKEFDVNNQHIFVDTTLTDRPNFYNYKKRAAEINVTADALLEVLQSFYAINTVTFRRKEGYYMFESESYLNSEKGYIYSTGNNFKVGDSISMGRTYYITRQVDLKWFEYKY